MKGKEREFLLSYVETSRKPYPKPVKPVFDDRCLTYLRAIILSRILHAGSSVSSLFRQLSLNVSHVKHVSNINNIKHAV